MEITIGKKKYGLRFGMLCWEAFTQLSIARAEGKQPKATTVEALADVIEGAIANANKYDGDKGTPGRASLEKWIDSVGVTERGAKQLEEIENNFSQMFQYQAFLKETQKKKANLTP